MLYSIVAILIIILDQGVKLMVNNMASNEATVKTLIPGVISLVRVQNDGAAFSFLAGGGARIWFIVLTLIFVALVIIALVTNFISGKFGRWCMVIVAAGGISNCIDRVLYGYVLDMFRIDLFDFAVFNVADIFITVGCIAFIIYILFGGEKDSTPEDKYDEDDDEEEDTPVRQPLFKKRKSYYEEEDDEDDEDEDEDEAPRKKAAAKAVLPKKSKVQDAPKTVKKTSKSDKNAEEILARARAAKEAETTANHRNADEEAKAFEEFFKKRAESKQVSEAPAKAKVKTVPVETEEREAPVKTRQTTAEAVQVQKKKIEVPPEVSHTEPSSSDDFDLDSILNEFK